MRPAPSRALTWHSGRASNILTTLSTGYWPPCWLEVLLTVKTIISGVSPVSSVAMETAAGAASMSRLMQSVAACCTARCSGVFLVGEGKEIERKVK